MESIERFCVILAGGGNQLWPVTRKDRPKQFVKIPGLGKSMVRQSFDRLEGLIPKENRMIISPSPYDGILKEAFPDVPEENVLLEPYARKTGPAIAYAMYSILSRKGDAIVAITPSDSHIADEAKFRETMEDVFGYVAEHDVLMTLGVKPRYAETNYGYIQVYGGKGVNVGKGPMKVKTFTEKPPKYLANVFCNSGEFFWNSGIIVAKASVLREEMEKGLPQIMGFFSGWEGALGTSAEKVFVERAYADCEKVSIDSGVMEKTDRAWLYPLDCGWLDINGWESFYGVLPKSDASGNLTNLREVELSDCKGNLVLSDNQGKMVAVSGLDDFMVIDTKDVLLICPRSKMPEFVTPEFLRRHEKHR